MLPDLGIPILYKRGHDDDDHGHFEPHTKQAKININNTKKNNNKIENGDEDEYIDIKERMMKTVIIIDNINPIY